MNQHQQLINEMGIWPSGKAVDFNSIVLGSIPGTAHSLIRHQPRYGTNFTGLPRDCSKILHYKQLPKQPPATTANASWLHQSNNKNFTYKTMQYTHY